MIKKQTFLTQERIFILKFPDKLTFFHKKVEKSFVFNKYCYYICERNKQKEKIMYNSLYIVNNLNLVVLHR